MHNKTLMGGESVLHSIFHGEDIYIILRIGHYLPTWANGSEKVAHDWDTTFSRLFAPVFNHTLHSC